MGHTTKISDYEWDRGDGPKEVPEGVDIDQVSTTRAKKVEPEAKPEPKKSTAKTKG